MGQFRPDPPLQRAAMTVELETKHAPGAISGLTREGSFEGYASLFGLVDMGRDLVVPGAFKASLAKRGASGIKMLWAHDATEPIGTWVTIVEDNRGLKVRGQLNLAVARAREILALMRDGALDGLSIGFRTERSQRDKETGVRRLLKLDLWEISIVTFPMLPQARVSAVKRAPPPPSHRMQPDTLATAIRKATNVFR